jgi:hypothetical protein
LRLRQNAREIHMVLHVKAFAYHTLVRHIFGIILVLRMKRIFNMFASRLRDSISVSLLECDTVSGIYHRSHCVYTYENAPHLSIYMLV